MVLHLVNRCITLQLLVMPSLRSSLQVKCPHNNHRILPCNIINVAAGDPWIKKLPAIVTIAGPKNAMSNMTRCRFYMFCTCAFLLPLRYVFASVKQPLRQWACCGLGNRDGLAKCQLWQAKKKHVSLFIYNCCWPRAMSSNGCRASSAATPYWW